MNQLRKFLQTYFFGFLVMASCFASPYSDPTDETYELSDSLEKNLNRYYESKKISESAWTHAAGMHYYARRDRMPELVMVPQHWQAFLKEKGLQDVLPTQPCKEAETDDERRADMENYKYAISQYGSVSNALEEMFRTLQAVKPNSTTEKFGEQISLRGAAVHRVNHFFRVCGLYMVPEKVPWTQNMVFMRFGKGSLVEEKNDFIRSLSLIFDPYNSATSRFDWFLKQIIAFNTGVLEERARLNGPLFTPEKQFPGFYERKKAERQEGEALKGRHLEALFGMREYREEQALKAGEARRKAAEEKAQKEEAERRAAEEARVKAEQEAARKAAEEKAQEEAARRAAEEKAQKKEAARLAAAEKARVKAEQEAAQRKAAEEKAQEEAARRAAEEEDCREAAERRAATSSSSHGNDGIFNTFLARIVGFFSGNN